MDMLLNAAGLPTIQIVFIAILGGVAAIMLLVSLYFIYLVIFKPDLKKEIAMMDKLYKEEKKLIIADKKAAAAEIRRSEKELDDKEKRIRQMQLETEQMRIELMRQGLREDQAKEVADMTLYQLIDLKNKERQDLSGDFVINAVTRKVLIDSEFEPREDVKDFRVPVNKTFGFDIKTLETYTRTLPDAVYKKSTGARSSDTYKVLGKTFAFFRDQGDAGYRLTFKCGPFFGSRLMQLYPNFVSKAKFPYGMIWFDLELGESCSLELIKLLILISYNIAKAGY